MTVVPHVDNYKKRFVLSCGKEHNLNAAFHLAVPKLEADLVTATGGSDDSEVNLKYTDYKIKKFSVSHSDTFTASTNGELKFGGTLVCNKTAAMPMTFEYQQTVSEILICDLYQIT